jgi:AraC family transcriptional regulator
MSTSSRSLVPFVDARSRRRVHPLNHAVVQHSSKDLGWSGLHVELASHDGWEVDDVQVDAHYLAVNRDEKALVIERKVGTGFRKEVVPPGTLVLHPAGESFSFRVAQGSRWGGVVLAPRLVELTLGGHVDMPAAFGACDPQVVSLVNALVDETVAGGPTGALYAEHLGAALALRLAGCYAPGRLGPRASRGGITPQRLRRIDDYIEAHLDRRVSLEELAALAELSLSHFARQFKVTSGRAPHEYVLHRRLERARQMLLETGGTVSEIAVHCGFSDPSHFVRAFRRHFGATPGHWRSRSRYGRSLAGE